MTTLDDHTFVPDTDPRQFEPVDKVAYAAAMIRVAAVEEAVRDAHRFRGDTPEDRVLAAALDAAGDTLWQRFAAPDVPDGWEQLPVRDLIDVAERVGVRIRSSWDRDDLAAAIRSRVADIDAYRALTDRIDDVAAADRARRR